MTQFLLDLGRKFHKLQKFNGLLNKETENLTSWFPPFSFNDSYSNIQVIYLDREMQKINVKLTGIQLRYDAKEEGVNYTTPVRISIMNTDKNYFHIDENYNVHMLDGDWKTVYEGDITVSGKENEKNIPLVIPFKTEYEYKGGNIAVRYERLWNDVTLEESQLPLFHLCSIYSEGDPNYNRTAIFRSKFTQEIDVTKVGINFWTPFTMFSYTDISSGVENLVSSKEDFRVYQSGSMLNFSKTVDMAQLISISGVVVRSAHQVDCLAVSGLGGVYLLKVENGGKTVTKKVVIK